MILYKCVLILLFFFKKKLANNHNILTNKLITIFTLTKKKKKQIFPIWCCGDRLINRPIGFRIGSGLLGQRPIRGRIPVRGHHAPRQYVSEDDRVRGRSGRGLTAIRSQNSVISKGRVAD